jgi:hypothetical protein
VSALVGSPILPKMCLDIVVLIVPWVCRTVVRVRGESCTDIVSILYDPDNPFTPAEEECVMQLIEVR